MRRVHHRRRPSRLHRRGAAGPRRTAGGDDREGPPPAFPHRRIAAAGQRAAVRQAGPARGGRQDRPAQVRGRVRLDREGHQQRDRLRRRLGQEHALRLAGASRRTGRVDVPPRREAGRRDARGLPREGRGLRCRGRHRHRGAGRRRRAPLAREVRAGLLRPRHLPGPQVQGQAAQPAAQQLGHLRAFPRRLAQLRPASASAPPAGPTT
jgi:hypothetical protein